MPRLTDRLPLRGSGLSVSPFCQGMTDDPKTIAAAYEAGINFFFISADMHWPLYEGIRQGIADLLASGVPRASIVVAGVSYAQQPEFCFAAFSELVEAVPGLGHVDVELMGGCYAHEFLVRQRAFHRQFLSQEGDARARSMGATFHDRQASTQALNGGMIDIGFVRYNTVHKGAEKDVLALLNPNRRKPHALLYMFKTTLGYVAPSRLDELGIPAEKWRPHRVDHYRHVLSFADVDGILGALQTPQQVSALVTALAQDPITEQEASYMMQLSELDSGDLELEAATPEQPST